MNVSKRALASQAGSLVGRPRKDPDVVRLVKVAAAQHPDWGCRRLADYLLANNGEYVGVTTVWRILRT